MKILLFFFILSNIYLSGSEINGNVSDENGERLISASVYIKSLKKGVYTNRNGEFHLKEIPEGSYKLEASYVGFSKESKTFSIKKDQKLNINFILAPFSDSEEVVVTGSMKPTYIKDSPIKIEVVTDKQIETYMPSAATSIVESISLVNGVQEVVACGVCFTNQISINGLPGPYTAILMDGMPIYGNLASVYGLNGIPAMLIDRFEVIKGPSSTLYGSEAVAGVVNIITKDPEEQAPISLDIMGTTHQESFGNIGFAPKIFGKKGFIGLNYAYMNNYEDENDDFMGDMINLDRYSLFTKWNLSNSKKRFDIAAKYYYEDRRNGTERFLQDRNYLDLRGNDSIYGESIFTNRFEVFGAYELPTSEYFRIDFSFSQHHQDSYYGADYYRADQTVGFSNFIWNRALGNHDLMVGATARYQLYDDNTIATPTQDEQFIPGIFIQNEWKQSQYFTALAGLRLDNYKRHGAIFSPRLSLKAQPGYWTSVRANFGTGFRIVNLFTEDHAFVTGQRQVIIEEELEPESSYNFSLSVNHIYNLLGSGSLDIEGFYTYFANKIIPDYDTDGEIRYGNTDGYAETMGFGVSINHDVGIIPLSFQAGINVARASESRELGGNRIETEDIEFAPRWTGIFTANYRITEWDLLIAYTAQITGPMLLPEVFDLNPNTGIAVSSARPTLSNPFAIQSLQVSKEFDELFSVYLGFQNLGNYIQQLSPLVGFNDPNSQPGFSEAFDTAYSYSPIHGREFYLGIKWNL